jgi:hypothetical protein
MEEAEAEIMAEVVEVADTKEDILEIAVIVISNHYDGNEIQVHPAYQFSSTVWANIPRDEQERLRNERNDYRNVRQMTSHNQGYGGYNNNPPPSSEQRSIVSEITTGRNNNDSTSTSGSIMGGRNEQASLRSRNPNNNN